jgi:hypothetical protein
MVLALTLRWTNPSFNADTTIGCVPSLVPLTDLATVQIWIRPQETGVISILRELPAVAGRPMEETLDVSWVGLVWLTTRDSTGNQSCNSHSIGVNYPEVASAPPALSFPGDQWYDIAGRCIERPTTPGVYLRRQAGVPTKKIVILR